MDSERIQNLTSIVMRYHEPNAYNCLSKIQHGCTKACSFVGFLMCRKFINAAAQLIPLIFKIMCSFVGILLVKLAICLNSKPFFFMSSKRILHVTTNVMLYHESNAYKWLSKTLHQCPKELLFCWVFCRKLFVLKISGAASQLVPWIFEIMCYFVGVYKTFSYGDTFLTLRNSKNLRNP